ncbi:hypothetical protein PIB30_017526 [Stylosanthes scabra]|uniref:Leucine-rich repeat-containing N-terminal plant-type domain-containing protein n=1 Tax=Stylosanthes scabra TaxID=79078 RepID=A0ABU6R7Z0_9FABA|nr:hypothetical protein [Stylosanthes scabra]
MSNSKTVRCDEKDKNTLLKFKHGLTDFSGVLSSWSTEKKDCCQWRGVHCNNTTGKVAELNLHCQETFAISFDDLHKSKCLKGELDMSSLFDLEFLTHLDLSNNDFNTIQYNTCGTPSHECGNSSGSNIRYLDLSENDNLRANNILHWVSNLSSLQYLYLSGINLQKEENWLESVTLLPSLSELWLANCRLQDIYPTLPYANFTSLKVLNLFGNEFVSRLPTWLFNLSCGITHIDISKSFIHGQLPETLPYFLQGLELLSLQRNDLNGSIPNWVGQLEQIQKLKLSDNLFSGPIPTSLGNLSSLITLYLGDNLLTGIVSEIFFHLNPKLVELALGSPSLIFDFDPKWIPPFQLQAIHLSYLNSELPSWVYTQTSLTLLHIDNSRMLLEPPLKFWRFVSDHVEYLFLFNNSINGNMSNMLLNSKVVWLIGNNLRGGVPQISSNVTILNLAFNFLSGPISPFLCHEKKERNLKYLDMSHNLLSKEIPDCWMHWKSLLYINLEDNNLIGQIPHSIGSLSNLFSLTLYHNMLSGEVPLSLKNCTKLRLLNLGENKFFGAISSWVGQSVIGLQLRSNQFSGNISPTICQLHSLEILDLSNNRLSGPIPSCCRNITSMISKNESFESFYVTFPMTMVTFYIDLTLLLLIKGIKLNYTHSIRVVDLSSNNLSGSVPSELFMLTGLQSLNLSRNQLMGKIPQDIGNLTLLESLDLSSNLFSGQIPQSMSALTFLGALNLSCNNFEGKIPSGTQLQGFTNLSYMGNSKLCGPPLTKVCPQDEKPPNEEQTREENEDEDGNFEVQSWFCMGLGIGFATSFLGVLIAVFFNERFRHAYFTCLSQFYYMLTQNFNSIS